jgi:small subunit ribosomal protein S21
MSVNVTVYVRKDEPIDRALKRLKAKMDKESILDIVRNKRSYETTAQTKKRKAKALTKSWKFLKINAQNAKRNKTDMV